MDHADQGLEIGTEPGYYLILRTDASTLNRGGINKTLYMSTGEGFSAECRKERDSSPLLGAAIVHLSGFPPIVLSWLMFRIGLLTYENRTRTNLRGG
jgi:hypothetical protein